MGEDRRALEAELAAAAEILTEPEISQLLATELGRAGLTMDVQDILASAKEIAEVTKKKSEVLKYIKNAIGGGSIQ